MTGVMSSGSSPVSGAETSITNFDVGKAELEYHGEDSILVLEDQLLFGIFDGMGSGANPKFASRLGRDVLARVFNGARASTEAGTINLFKTAFEETRQGIVDESPEDVTTATVAKILEIDSKYRLIWGNAGDSRMFLRHQRKNIETVTTDQSTNNLIHNGLGERSRSWPRAADEFGSLALNASDQIMICSDGITGDWEEQLLDDNEMSWAFDGYSAQDCAERFISVSKKRDDKSVIVINANKN